MKPKLRWSKHSTAILSAFLVTILLIGYIWWPLLRDYLQQVNPAIPVWRQVDWLLIGNFLVMSMLVTLGADLRYDIPFALIGLIGGFLIESWGTRTGLWFYYTYEMPPLWIIPAWPIAALSVNRISHYITQLSQRIPDQWFRILYWPVFGIFYVLLFWFVWPTILHPLTIFALVLCLFFILSCKNRRSALIIFTAGSFLGFFLERWGTTRLCWTYHIPGSPPAITVLAHGMASMAIWRAFQIMLEILRKFSNNWIKNILPQPKM